MKKFVQYQEKQIITKQRLAFYNNATQKLFTTKQQQQQQQNKKSWWYKIRRNVLLQQQFNDTFPDFDWCDDIYNTTIKDNDWIELDHCGTSYLKNNITTNVNSELETVDWQEFVFWALPLVNTTLQKLESKQITYHTPTIVVESLMELFEMYLTNKGFCNFEEYRPTVVGHDKLGHKLQEHSWALSGKVTRSPRIVFSIVAFQDVHHLRRLVRAVHLPQHYILIHLDQSVPVEFEQQINTLICPYYDNIYIVRFGTIIYRTDSVSRVNLRIMQWIHFELQLRYDYFITLGGAVYPLYAATELADHLQPHQDFNRSVWLGALSHQGQSVRSPQVGYIWKKRLVLSNVPQDPIIKLKFVFGTDTIPEWIDSAMQYKTTSGNQGVYSRDIIQRLLSNSKVWHLFALAKYGCCCCIEERIWIAALYLIGSHHEALQYGSMFQVWGGDHQRCRASMHNAWLSSNGSTCFRLEDDTLGIKAQDKSKFIWGNEIMSYLSNAKDRGFLFARKFHSDHSESIDLIRKIQQGIHKPTGVALE